MFALLAVLAANGAETIVWQDNFDDGNGDDRWYPDGTAAWQIGSPIGGPPTNSSGYHTHSGQFCVTSGLNGNYLPYQDSRIIRIASFVVPAATNSPRLRFWQWYRFADYYWPTYYSHDEGSYGYVEIKAGTNNWQQISPTYSYYTSCGDVWTRPSIDLTPFAGKSVQIAFHFHSAYYTEQGWYVDDIQLVTGTPVFSNPEGFELGLGDWVAESGTWEVGVPTAGPSTNAVGFRAHSGTNCAATVLASNYSSYADSRLVSPAFVVPASNSFPRLRFWQWYRFADYYWPVYYSHDEGSYGYVEIKAGTNNWQQVSPTYTYYTSCGGVWTRPSIDLAAFAGQTIQIAFYFHSAFYTEQGWYVDDVEVATGTPVLSNPEGFELGLADWAAETGTWEVGMPTAGPVTNAAGFRAHSGTNCAATVLGSNYSSYADSRLVSPAFVVPASNSFPRLRFWHWYRFADYYWPVYYSHDEGSYGYVEIKAGTNNWQQVSPTYTYYTSCGGVWTRPSIDLAAFAGQTVQVGFHFHSAFYTDLGWYVDEVEVVTGRPVLTNPEGFELGLGDWSAESGTWEVGVPTSGPGVAYSGTNCAATVLAKDYENNADSRLVSPPFLLPPVTASPALRWRQSFRFAGGDWGRVEIKPTGTDVWIPLQTNAGISVGWTSAFSQLSSFAGKQVQIAFHFYSDSSGHDAGWFIDDIRLSHDFSLVLLDSPIVRTQTVDCIPFGIAQSVRATDVSFNLGAPTGYLSNAILNTESCWGGGLNPLSDSTWLINLHNNCSVVPMGVVPVGSICFNANSSHSGFVPLSVSGLTVTNFDGSSPVSYGFGGRTVVIANEPLLEATIGPNRQRLATTFGKAGVTYEIRQTTNVADVYPQLFGWSNTVPASLFYTAPVQGPLSDAPVLFLRANEK